ncbi:MAG: prepilin-type N-terminal cleavage/methylation domain-containing protein [Pseudomonadota bacterium]
MNRSHFRFHRQRQAGFTLVEALIAFLVMAFGMLAVAGFQTTMSRNSDVAKQRSEAVRLGQQKIESLRTFQQVRSDGAGTIVNYEDDVVSGGPETINPSSADPYATNATYARQWWVTKNDGSTAAGAGDLEKWIRVQVAWTDRAGEAQSVTLRSVISRSDPIDLGTLFTGPNGSKTRTPKNRNINIPYPAVDLGNNKSGFTPPGGGSTFYVFDNTTGIVEKICTGTPIPGFDTTGCTSTYRYLLSGYIRFFTTTGGGAVSASDIENTTDPTKDLTVSLKFVSPTPTAQPYTCFAQRQKVVSAGNVSPVTISTAVRSGSVVTITTSGNHGMSAGQTVGISSVADTSFDGQFTIASAPSNTTLTYTQAGASASSTGGTAVLVQQITIEDNSTVPAPPGYTSVVSRFVAYACLVEPFDHDGDGNTPTSTALRWSGQMVITPLTTTDTAAWSLGTTSGTFQLCRYTGDYVSDNIISNSEHPLYYRGVTGALDNQNYVVLAGNKSCPTDSEANTATGHYFNANTKLHQSQAIAGGTQPYGGAVSQGTQWGTGSAGEQGTSTEEFPMF